MTDSEDKLIKNCVDKAFEDLLGPEFKTGDIVEVSRGPNFTKSEIGEYVGESYGAHFIAGNKNAYQFIKSPAIESIDGVPYFIKTSVLAEIKKHPVIPKQ